MAASVGHEIVRASAGTGKTYQLTNRYLRLLVLTEAPEKIIALTFTRKAAGEFFEKIFQKLATAASDEKEAARLAAELTVTADRTSFLRLMRLVIERMNRLNLATFDSFFGRIARSFPFELGLPGAPAVLDESEQAEAVRQVQQALGKRAPSNSSRLERFRQAFKLATFGREEKRLSDQVADYIDTYHELYLDAPEAEAWGGEAMIWNGPCPWRSDQPDLFRLADEIRTAVQPLDLTDRQRQDWDEICASIRDWEPGMELPTKLAGLAAKVLPELDDLPAGNVEIKIRRSLTIPPELGRPLRTLFRFIVWQALEDRLLTTRGVHDVVALFEELYHEAVRRQSRLTFGDVTRLLAPPDASMHSPTRFKPADAEARLRLDFRLDGSLDHWLFDEFQDTSYAQWRAVENLADEAIQDPEGRKSFFAVGDTKQSLYIWRQSDDRLFDRLLKRYKPVLASRTLARSFRSAPPVLEMVNAVFGSHETLAQLFNNTVSERWQQSWADHVPADPVASKDGYSALVRPAEGENGSMQTTLELLEAIRPLAKGLSAAILVQTNREAAAVLDYLRSHGGPPATMASEIRPGADNPLAVLLHSLLQAAAHPSDTLAWNHVLLSPLGSQTLPHESLSRDILTQIAAHGFEKTLKFWIQQIEAELDSTDTFTLLRAEQILEAARQYDRRGERNIDTFLAYLDTYALRENDQSGSVSVLTIHKAKGLDWDVVILPDLKSQTLLERRNGPAVKRDGDGKIQWILNLPKKDLLAGDSALSDFDHDARNDGCFERLCVLYVALTRARQGLYLISEPPSARSKSPNYARLLDETLGATEPPLSVSLGDTAFDVAWQTGNPDWFAAKTTDNPQKPEEIGRLEPLPEPAKIEGKRFPALRPSDEGESPAGSAGRRLFAPESRRAIDFGSQVHGLFERIEWLPGDPAERKRIVQTLGHGLAEEIVTEVTGSLAVPAVVERYFRSAPGTRLWRERPFEIILDEKLVSGKLDRALILEDRSGRPVAARILDFKTDRIAPGQESAAADRHSNQLLLYRKAVARLLAIDFEAVSAELLFTHTGTLARPTEP